MSNPALSQSPKLAEQSLPAVVRKSRDSGFVGSLDDLLRRDAGGESTPTGASSCNMGSSDSGHSLSDGEGSTSASNSGATATPSVVSSASKRGQTGAMQLEKVDEENLATDGAATSSSQASSPSHAPSTPPTGNLATTTNLNLQATSKEAAVEQSLDSSPENHPESFARSNPARARVIQPRYTHSLNFINLFAHGKVAGRKNRTRNHFLNVQISLTFDTYEFT